MQNIAHFRIIGRISKIDAKEKVSFIDVASNYNRQKDGEWTQDTHWNRVTAFGKVAERVAKAGKGDLVHIEGRMRQSSYEADGKTVYGVDLIADGFAILANPSGVSDDDDQDVPF